jgi:phage virion morphogenesis protein
MVGVRVEGNLEQARSVLDRALREVESPLGLMEVAGAVLENSVRERFRTGSGPGGVPWPPSRRVAQGGGRTLVDKGGLESSIASEASVNRVEVGVIAKTRSAKFAHVHQFGATITPKKGPYLAFRGADGHMVFAKSVTIPARPFLGIDQEDRQDLVDAWTAYLEERVA